MTFYTDPAFFILLAVFVIPAVALGFLGKPLRLYGFAASVVFILLLFSKSPAGLAALVFYLAFALTVTKLYLHAKTSAIRTGKTHANTAATSPTLAKTSATKTPTAPPPYIYPLALFAVLAPLVIYKCAAVFDANLLGFLGISYITFKTVQVVLEIHDGLITKIGVLDYLYFLIFFPSFTSGPILRSRNFMEDLRAALPRAEYRELFTRGLYRFLIGAFYKIVCSSVFSVAIWVIPRALGDSHPALAVLGQIGSAYAYGFYLFFDFAGYSLMAMGAGAMFGIHVPRNFKAPFISLDIKDFWNRWHITLSYWLRDFVFMRLARTLRRRKLKSSRLVTSCLGYMANMTLMGMWHGLTPQYIAYGVYHGALLALTEIFQKTAFYKRNKDRRGYKIVSWFITFNLVMFGFALFSGQVF